MNERPITAPATRRTRPDGWLVLQSKWHWVANIGNATEFACGQAYAVTAVVWHHGRAYTNVIAQSGDLRDAPGDYGDTCSFCQEAAAKQTPA